jgi:3-hydroxyisobutyrate dehydrogenase-like beta-hydroxyacid dehydrogenase
VTQVGFAGAGLMGAPMVRNLIAAGFDVVVSSRHPARLADEGWTVVGSPAEAADGADVFCSIVPDSPEVTDVISAALPKLRAGAVVVEMSTIAPKTARHLASECAAVGVDYLDCPVSGGPPGAQAGTLAIWVGGDAAAMDRARPVLEVIGAPEKIRHCGDVGAGLVVKLANNFLGAVNAAASAEALAMARENGLDPALVADAVMDGSGANWQMGNLMRHRVLRGEFNPGFKISHMAKDLRIAAEVALAAAVDQPVGRAARDRLERARREYGDDVDYGSVARLLGF